MKKLCTILVFLCFALHGTAKKKNDLEMKGLSGRVASVTCMDSSSQKQFNGAVCYAGPDYSYTTNAYDEHGNQVLCSFYDKNDHLVRQTTDHYDASNNKTESVMRRADGRLIDRYVYKYNMQAYPVATDIYNGSDSLVYTKDLRIKYMTGKYVELYDTAGKQTAGGFYLEDGTVKMSDFAAVNNRAGEHYVTLHNTKGKDSITTHYNADSTIRGRTMYLYDENGNQTEAYYYNDKGARTITKLNKYDSRGNLLVSSINKQDGGHDNKQEYTYDANGNKTGYKVYLWKNEYILKRCERYNEAGQQTEMTGYNDNGTFESRYVNTYDAKGNKVQYATYNKDGSITGEIFYWYEAFDTKGNWTKAMSWSREENTMNITYREISYYQ